MVLLAILHRLDPETAHYIIIALLKIAGGFPGARRLMMRLARVDDPRLRVSAFGLGFENPVGVAAGLDKNGLAINGLTALGFGHIEIGTVTPLPQPGNPRPRLFRLIEDEGLVNRLGFPNLGLERAAMNLARARKDGCLVGANVGPNKSNVEVSSAILDYIKCLQGVHSYADYLTINISSPNTPGLRALQDKGALRDLLGELFRVIDEFEVRKPLLMKISPDMSEKELSELLDVALSFPVAGIIATNTTVDRPAGLIGAAKNEAGGLSGGPLREKSTSTIRTIFRATEGRLPVIGVGGVFTAADVVEKMRAGASMVQLYTGMVYKGAFIGRNINRGLLEYLEVNRLGSIQELIGTGEE
ncbi:MAG: quinone-dependent dihydroorotate dehydrogenase [Dehalococcoidia bacterium]|nr:quinone-dependent dihydroorotate dehydrogenase [Dehalococcoidia bacterium]